MITILMPLADGEHVHPWTLASIATQSVHCGLVPISRPRNSESRRLSEAECRNELKKYASIPYAFYLDSDAYFTSPNDVADCLAFLDKHTEHDAVALDTKALGSIEKQSQKFVVIAAMCVRWNSLQRVTFRPTYEDGRERCLCVAANKDLKVTYLDHRRLGEVSR